MSKSKGMEVASLFAGLLLCMTLIPTAFAAGWTNVGVSSIKLKV